MDLLIIGAGLSGAVIANRAAETGKKVLILEKRENIGGNVFDKEIDGIMSHIYGPHIFHTDNDKVYNFMNDYWELNDYKNIVEAKVKGNIIPLPFNFKGIDVFFPDEAEEIKQKLVSKYGKDSRVTIFKLRNQEDKQLKKVAEFVYDNIFLNYTSKMWGKKPEEIDESVASRVPVIIGYNNRYFSNKYEGIPKEGYTKAINNLLNHPNIKVLTNINAIDVLDLKNDEIYYDSKIVECPIVYSGQIDELFNFKEGVLNYRSLSIEFKTIAKKQGQATAVLNDPSHPTITRTVEQKLLTLQKDTGNKTVISSESPGKYDRDSKDYRIPFYPMADDESRKQYQKYADIASKYKNLHLIGRLATYQYIDMDQTINLALDKAEELIG